MQQFYELSNGFCHSQIVEGFSFLVMAFPLPVRIGGKVRTNYAPPDLF